MSQVSTVFNLVQYKYEKNFLDHSTYHYRGLGLFALEKCGTQ